MHDGCEFTEQTRREMQNRLLQQRTEKGVWEGYLSSSPLAAAAAAFALHCTDAESHRRIIADSLDWLCRVQNPDGGWGDTDGADPSNLSATLLCRAALFAAGGETYIDCLARADRWISGRAGSPEPERIIEAVYRNYGTDRTFAVPILTMCMLAGSLSRAGPVWRRIVPLPFELAVLPRILFRRLNLSVVSYALPALIAMGQAKFHFDPPANPVLRWIRKIAIRSTLRLLQRIQPRNGGFLEAPPLTAFVTMCLASTGRKNHPVTEKGVRFLLDTRRPDGSWPIDTNLAVWLTTLSVKALLDSDGRGGLSPEERQGLCRWLLDQQFQKTHPFTGASPGGWGWTDRPGSVPDADDTAGALTALYRLQIRDAKTIRAAGMGIKWLLNLQNRDGGIPTFCRGWGKLEFDRSCPDLTAHAVEAWACWQGNLDESLQKRIHRAIKKAIAYLCQQQRPDGSFLPLWFGNPFSSDMKNPVYGSSRVLVGLSCLDDKHYPQVHSLLLKTADYLAAEQNEDGGWASQKGLPSRAEETALAVEALAQAGRLIRDSSDKRYQESYQTAVKKGVNYQLKSISDQESFSPYPIGLYFARLWYYERLYPLIFTCHAIQVR